MFWLKAISFRALIHFRLISKYWFFKYLMQKNGCIPQNHCNLSMFIVFYWDRKCFENWHVRFVIRIIKGLLQLSIIDAKLFSDSESMKEYVIQVPFVLVLCSGCKCRYIYIYIVSSMYSQQIALKLRKMIKIHASKMTYIGIHTYIYIHIDHVQVF